MRKIIIALVLTLGLILLISGAIVFSFSQDKISKKRDITKLYDKAYTPPYPEEPSFKLNLTQGQNFTASAPTLATPPTSYTGIDVYVEIIDPNNVNIVNATTDYWSYTGNTGGNWRAQLNPNARVCASNASIPVNATGTYTFTYSTDPPSTFLHIILYQTTVEPERSPNLYLQNPSVVLMAGGGIFTAIGVLTAFGLPKRKHKSRARKPLKAVS